MDTDPPAFTPQDTRADALRCLRASFAAAGIAEAALDARTLLVRAADITPTGLIAYPEQPLGNEAADRLVAFAARRLSGEPVGRILGEREFWGLRFRLTPETLEPRPDTETVVEAALRALPEDREALVLDLGTGSGCILLAILSERPNAWGIGIDLSPGAAAAARANALLNGLSDRAAFVTGRWAEPLDARFDLVVSNPPYIPTGDLVGLAREVTGHDPGRALDGGPDGLDAYRAIAAALPRLLRPGAAAILEIGHDQAEAVAAIAAEAGLTVRSVERDLAGKNRVLVASSDATGAGLALRRSDAM